MSKNSIIAVFLVVVAALLIMRSSAPSPAMEGENATTTASEETAADSAPLVPGKAVTVPGKTGTSALPTRDKDGAYLISYTDKGFSPATLEIPRGSSVKFVNNSSKAMRIGTTDTIDRKPTNEISQTTTVGKGQSFALTLNTPFTYGYKNMNNPTDTGVIVIK